MSLEDGVKVVSVAKIREEKVEEEDPEIRLDDLDFQE
jgi:hypothetical protein